ncbi:hypothetical protein TTHERM_00011940 (macronuclear) [Tetrahymena thermophila SB210]|uniref:Uncharacterized protein n=1 Tax=Tetrahymena thermophila (strain SB210) TaxID=312017 RepID=Q22RU4_TETTS|nr:hypothetical protein TTHERM_00011940 [Tetrahymena thermophila SB210]EAR88028.2 hypothetical protein TTHERM_00011940 [Tetrahymena thermophila SB210]|eukprot:XP_001008273.2 hypothetical protein TTHERM_00011940 [Tetrahymena thermophila SB210]
MPLLFKLKSRFSILKIILKADKYQEQNKMPIFKKWMFIKKSIQKICSFQSRRFLVTEENRPKSINFSKVNISIAKQEDSPLHIDINKKNVPQLISESKIQNKGSQQEVFLYSDFVSNSNSIQSPNKQNYKEQSEEQDNQSRTDILQRTFEPKKVLDLNQIQQKIFTSSLISSYSLDGISPKKIQNKNEQINQYFYVFRIIFFIAQRKYSINNE